MKKNPTLGDQEMDLLRYVGHQESMSVREVAEHFERERGLARTTVLTMMERLRKKGFLSRAKTDGVFRYSAKMETGDVLTSQISSFVEKTLGGSVSPLLAYFSSSKLSKDEVEQLRDLANKLEREQRK